MPFFVKFCSIDVMDDRITLFDTGPGMDNSIENNISKWYVLFIFFFTFSSFYKLNCRVFRSWKEMYKWVSYPIRNNGYL